MVLLAIAIPFAAKQSSHLSSGGYTVAGSGSAATEATLKRYFPETSETNLAALFWPHRSASANSVEDAIRNVEAALKTTRGVSLPRRSRELARFGVGLGPIVMPLLVTVGEADAQRAVESLKVRLDAQSGTHPGVDIHLLGESALWASLDKASKSELARAERVGVPILLIVLLAVFGSILAAALPLILGAVAVTATGAVIYFVSLRTPLSVFTTNTASMLGIGVAVDYSLILLARLREELGRGVDVAGARRVALATSGKAILFSGLTVVAALCGIFLVPVQALRSMALGAIIVVLISVAVTVSLLPALATILGSKRISRRWQMRSKVRPQADFWRRWTAGVMRHPKVAAALSGGVLMILCIPIFSLSTATGAIQQLSPHDDTRVGFSEAAQVVTPGSLGPIEVTATAQPSTSNATLQRWANDYQRAVAKVSGVHSVELPEFTRKHLTVLINVVPTANPESPGAKTLVSRLRSLRSPKGIVVTIGGASASQVDEQHAVNSAMWKIVAAVSGLAFIALLILLRSIVLPVKAVITTLMSVGASYGVLVAIFQWGWLHNLFGYHPLGHLETFTPPLILAIAFGLTTDYEVFLLSRIRERWLASGDSRTAVEQGITSSAGTISSAALILVCTFGVFVATGMPAVKEIGLGAAVAIALDATVVRLVLVPAVMALLGDRSWWMPGSRKDRADRHPETAISDTAMTATSGAAH
jgi:uncharacterized membrane protein YdfJ with MMPL/SSD domain